jgi:hypothetical protein
MGSLQYRQDFIYAHWLSVTNHVCLCPPLRFTFTSSSNFSGG